MGRVKFGAFGAFIGKIGPIVGYIRRGEAVSRSLPKKSNKPATEKQLMSQMQFKMAMRYVQPINDFVTFSFHQFTKHTTRIPQNAATSYFRKFAITGDYPDYQIDFSKLMVSMGDLPKPINPTVSLAEKQLTFTWEQNPDAHYERNEDQTMLLAYLPDTQRADFIVGGARRNAGSDTLTILPELRTMPNVQRDNVVELYIAFISNDRQRVSDSVYLGKMML